MSQRVVGRFPIQCHHMVGRSTIAVLAILRADPVTVLGDFSGKPLRLRQRGYQVADQLRLADAARVAADDDQAARR